MIAFFVQIMSVIKKDNPSDSSYTFIALGCVRQVGTHGFKDNKITPVGTE